MLMRIRALAAVSVVTLLAASPASADFRLERNLALPPGGAFTLETDLGSVTLTGDSASGAAVTITASRDDFDERFDLRFEESAGSVRVVARRRGGWPRSFWENWFGEGAHFAIRVPAQTAVAIRTSGGSVEASRLAGTALVHTSGGSLRLEAIEGDVHGSTSGGSIHLRDLGGDAVASTSGGSITIADVLGDVRANTSGGSIEIDRVAGDLVAETSGGHVQVRGAGGRVDAHTSGGPVTVGFAPRNNRGGDLSTSGGGVRAEIDPGVSLSIDARSSGGGIDSDLPLTVSGSISRNALRGDLNGGGPTLRLRSSGGGVRISRTPGPASRR